MRPSQWPSTQTFTIDRRLRGILDHAERQPGAPMDMEDTYARLNNCAQEVSKAAVPTSYLACPALMHRHGVGDQDGPGRPSCVGPSLHRKTAHPRHDAADALVFVQRELHCRQEELSPVEVIDDGRRLVVNVERDPVRPLLRVGVLATARRRRLERRRHSGAAILRWSNALNRWATRPVAFCTTFHWSTASRNGMVTCNLKREMRSLGICVRD
jgi:hypothetical protein